mmetsp:Transcript_10599/g.20849  ORF Transcript_10599/g.20849 Transcript_10599/m.20849 type:complete len:322 (-) Transcript_10599:283-1248(-)
MVVSGKVGIVRSKQQTVIRDIPELTSLREGLRHEDVERSVDVLFAENLGKRGLIHGDSTTNRDKNRSRTHSTEELFITEVGGVRGSRQTAHDEVTVLGKFKLVRVDFFVEVRVLLVRVTAERSNAHVEAVLCSASSVFGNVTVANKSDELITNDRHDEALVVLVLFVLLAASDPLVVVQARHESVLCQRIRKGSAAVANLDIVPRGCERALEKLGHVVHTCTVAVDPLDVLQLLAGLQQLGKRCRVRLRRENHSLGLRDLIAVSLQEVLTVVGNQELHIGTSSLLGRCSLICDGVAFFGQVHHLDGLSAVGCHCAVNLRKF